MDKEKTLLRLGIQIDTLKAHINRLKKGNYEIHQLDVDMLKKKTIEFYELVFELELPVAEREEIVIEDVKVDEVIEEQKVEVKPEVKDEVKAEVKLEPEPEIEKVVKPDIEEKAEVEPEVKPEIIPEIKVEPEVIVKEEKVVEVEEEKEIVELVAETPESEPESAESTTKQTAYDLFSGSADSAVAEKFHTSDEPSIAEKMQKTQITNIREAIGINEKFLFINELFNGDMGRYNKILDDINDLTTKQGVDTYLFELKVQFQWTDDNEAYIRLKELLDRKFS